MPKVITRQATGKSTGKSHIERFHAGEIALLRYAGARGAFGVP